MKRILGLVVLVLATSSAQADSISFSVGGHRVRIDAPRSCRSTSCASISIPGVYESRRKRLEEEDREVVAAPPPAPLPPAPSAPASVPAVGFAPAAPVQQVAPPPAPPPPAVVAPPPAPASKLMVVMVPAPAPLAVYKPAAATTQEVAAPPPPAPVQAVVQPRPPEPVAKPVEATPAPPVLKVLREEEPDSPVGDWQTENKGMVRIAECGRALCGYAVKSGEDAKGEAVLINMKPKTSVKWIGSVYSKDSGDTYYGSINMNGPNTLRVEACAFGRFYCNGNHWTRVPPRTDRVITSRQMDGQPRS